MPINPLLTASNAIHTVNTKFPYTSTTRSDRMIKSIGKKNQVLTYLYNYPTLCDPAASINRNKTPAQKKVLKIYKWFSEFIDKFEDVRNGRRLPNKTPFEYIIDIMKTVKKHRLANCGELAIMTTAALKSMGINNVCTASLTTKNSQIDHSVAVFNRDNSEFNGEIINNKTIIVDTWLGIADYAGNYFSKYRNFCSTFLNIPDGKIMLNKIQKYNLDAAQINELKSIYRKL